MVASPTTGSSNAVPMVMSPSEVTQLEVIESELKVGDSEGNEPTIVPESDQDQDQASASVSTPPVDPTNGPQEDASVQTTAAMPTNPEPMPAPEVPDMVQEGPTANFDVDGTSVTISHENLKGDVLRLRSYLASVIPGRSKTAKLPTDVASVRRNMIRQDQYLVTRRLAPSTSSSAGKASRRRTPGQIALLRSIRTLLKRLEAELVSEPEGASDGSEMDDEVAMAN